MGELIIAAVAFGFGLGTIVLYYLQVMPLIKLIAQMRQEGYVMNIPIPKRKKEPEPWLDIPE